VIQSLPEGIILKGVGSFYDVLEKDDPNSIYTCKVRGIHRKEGGLTPLPGDRVTFKVLDVNKHEGHIEQILDRRNVFVRPAVANIDQLAIVIAVNSPEPDLMLVDKLLITCQDKNIRPILAINKSDLDNEHLVEKHKTSYEGTGFTTLVLTKFQEEGYNALHKELIGCITAFAGQSGVGKSTILNTISNNWLMETGDVSDRIQRGKHTTRHAQLFRLDQGGFILDTPGFSSFAISDINHENLDSYYPEFSDVSGLCRFKGCSHTSEPDCAVRNLLDEGKLDSGRYNRYTELYKELKETYDNRYRR
jgi:ribosome biogenesis GTPase